MNRTNSTALSQTKPPDVGSYRRSRILALAALVVTIALFGCVPSPRSIPVPRKINTIADGYPFVLEFKNRIAPETELVFARVEMQRVGDSLEAKNLYYIFNSRTNPGRSIQIYIVNFRHQAFVSEHPIPYRHPDFPSLGTQPLVVSEINNDVPKLIEIAGTNGLAQFCKLAPGESGTVDVVIGSSTNGPRCLVVGSGSEDKEGVELRIEIDPRSGSVLSQSLKKSD